MRGERALTIIGWFALWLGFIGLSFLAVGIAISMVYQLSTIGYRIITQSPTFPVDKFKFASSAACIALLFLIGVFAVHRPDFLTYHPDKKELPPQEIAQLRSAYRETALAGERRLATQSLVFVAIILLVDVAVYVVHWRMARRREPVSGQA